MTKTLIVYHSRTGYTRRIAQHLADRLGADLDEIRIVQPMHGVLGYAACAIEAMAGLAPALRPMRHKPADYDLVVVGTPVWFWSLVEPGSQLARDLRQPRQAVRLLLHDGRIGRRARVRGDEGTDRPRAARHAGADRRRGRRRGAREVRRVRPGSALGQSDGAAGPTPARRTPRRSGGCSLIRRLRGAGRGASVVAARGVLRAAQVTAPCDWNAGRFQSSLASTSASAARRVPRIRRGARTAARSRSAGCRARGSRRSRRARSAPA